MRYRSLKTLTQPAVEPVTLAEAKAHCRVDTSTDDAYIGSLIEAAREWCEAYCDETFVHKRYRMTLDSFPTEIELPRPPMATSGTVTAVVVTYTLENQSTAVLSTAEYRVDRDAVPEPRGFDVVIDVVGGAGWQQRLVLRQAAGSQRQRRSCRSWPPRGPRSRASSPRTPRCRPWS